MAPAGRPRNPIEQPRLPLERFAWLVRVLRANAEDPDINSPEKFALQLNSHLTRPLTSTSINKLERGTEMQFSVDKVRAYERVLDLDYLSLVDLFIFSSRVAGGKVDWQREANTDLEARFHDGVIALAEGQTLPPSELLALAVMAKRDHPGALRSRAGILITEAVLDSYGISFERDERILGEALIQLGDRVVPLIQERVTASPIQYFNAIESLAHIDTPASWQALLGFANSDYDSIRTQTIVQPIRKWLIRRPELMHLDYKSLEKLKTDAMASVIDMHDAYTSREENLHLLQLLKVSKSDKQIYKEKEMRSDIEQLTMREVSHTRRELLNHIDSSADDALSRTSGLRAIVEDAIYVTDRVERLSVGALLGISATFHPALKVTATALWQDPDAGVQRSIIRLMAKAGSSDGLREVANITRRRPPKDEGVRLAAAWALGMSDQAADKNTLEQLRENGAPTTRVVAEMSLRRRGFHINA
ncbi:HEAT repeat domain-containing protein [Rathayibacter sp. AY1A5]|uniref:HEAT repeat domain-containing protein n=1 Tax=Rathayibacter sp. AY1A5 TaxID=2080523 RepID=UPI0011B0DAC6|nr:HEAT repeat domain-containing protein [Rathayibacter sp. AY1A5]